MITKEQGRCCDRCGEFYPKDPERMKRILFLNDSTINFLECEDCTERNDD